MNGLKITSIVDQPVILFAATKPVKSLHQMSVSNNVHVLKALLRTRTGNVFQTHVVSIVAPAQVDDSAA